MTEVFLILIILACSFASSYMYMEIREKNLFSKNNKIEINCFTTTQDEKGNFPELKFFPKNLEEALQLKRKYEYLGWIVILTATSKTKGKEKC